jgi:hypothetical protein
MCETPAIREFILRHHSAVCDSSGDLDSFETAISCSVCGRHIADGEPYSFMRSPDVLTWQLNDGGTYVSGRLIALCYVRR